LTVAQHNKKTEAARRLGRSRAAPVDCALREASSEIFTATLFRVEGRMMSGPRNYVAPLSKDVIERTLATLATELKRPSPNADAMIAAIRRAFEPPVALPANVLEWSIYDLGLSERIAGRLDLELGVITVADLIRVSADKMLARPNFGIGMVEAVEARLVPLGLSLAKSR
jgi:hypothetical protein